ncbi:hypothetical protein ACIRS1_07095, partial [Kitasatospora sp. NPDC101176]
MTVVLMLLGMVSATAATAQAAPQRTAASIVCSNSPIPPGWVITSSYSSSGCPGTGVAYTIADVSGLNGATVCSM